MTRRRVGLVALLIEATAFAVLLAAAGTPVRRSVEVVVVLAIGAALILVEQRGGRAARGWVAVLAGTAGVVTGAGIGVMHAARSDLTLAAVAALVAFAAGLLLLGAGVIRLWRSTPGWWRLLALPVAFVLVQFVVEPATLAIYATHVPATRPADTTPADRGLAYRDVTVRGSDGVPLSAWYLPSRNRAAVLALHGSGSTRAAVLDEAVVLARHGYGVLLLDARGHGRSGGTAMDFGWWGDRDVAAGVRWLQSQPDVDPDRIGALGLSMGGEEAIGAAASNTAVRAVVAEGALWRGSMDAGWLPHSLPGYIDRGVLAVQTWVAGLLTAAPQPISLRRAIRAAAPRPVLLIADDPEIRGDRYLRAAAPASVQLWELPDTPHVAALDRHPAQWEARVIAFLDRALLGR